MAKKYYSTLTKIGLNAIARATTMNEKVKFSKFCLGDGVINPDINTFRLTHQVFEGSISSISVDENNPNWIALSCTLSATVGGFTIREVGIKDEDGNLLAVASYPETYKPVLSEGAGKDLIIKVILEVSNASVVELKIDPSVTLATKSDLEAIEKKVETVEQKVAEGVENLDVSEKQIEFIDMQERILPTTKDTLKTIVAKVVKYLKDLKTVAFTGRYSDLTGIPESFPPAAHNHDDRYLGKKEKAESAKRADVATTAEQVQGFQFRNQDGKLEVLVEGEWIRVGGRQYTKLHYFSSKDLPEWQNGIIGRNNDGSVVQEPVIVTLCDIKNNAGIVRNLSVYHQLEIIELYVDGVRITKDNFAVGGNIAGLLRGYPGAGILLTHKQSDSRVYSTNVIEFSKSLKIIGRVVANGSNSYGSYDMLVATEK